MPKEIPLTQGYKTIVDDCDYDFLMQWKWHVCIGHQTVYAMRNSEFIGGNYLTGKRHHIMMHRVLNGTPDGMDTDHINGNGLDNRRENLRTATRSQNMWNRHPNRKGKSRYKGVSWHKQHRKWIANIQVQRKRIFLGLFRNEKEAADAYAKRAAIEFTDFNKEIYYGA